MFKNIRSNKELYSIITTCCCENDIKVNFSEFLEENFDEKVLILKPDLFYSSKKITNPPPAVDCLILVKCNNNKEYSLYLVELKNIKSPKGFNKKNIENKFKTVLVDFLQNKFKNIFMQEKYCDFNCYFVSNPYRCKNITQKHYESAKIS